jgi:Ca2+-binding EF-hand superfamily protein
MDKKAQMKAEKYFTEMDMDSDGKVTMDESRKFGDNMFNEVDTDNNNYLTKSELVEHKKMEMKKWHDMKADSIETETNTTTTNTKKTSY